MLGFCLTAHFLELLQVKLVPKHKLLGIVVAFTGQMHFLLPTQQLGFLITNFVLLRAGTLLDLSHTHFCYFDPRA